MSDRVARNTFRLSLFVDGKEFPCVDFASEFGINKIPTAVCTLAVGVDAHRRTLSPVHKKDVAEVLTRFSPAKVVLQVKGAWAPGDRDPYRWTKAGPQVVFEGYVTGAGYRKVRGQMAYSVRLIHWLADIAFASCLSDESHPRNPARFLWRAPFPGSNLEDSNVYFLWQTSALLSLTANNITEDLWAKCHHAMFCGLTQQNILAPVNSEACGGLTEKNQTAAATLRRFETHSSAEEEIGKDCEKGSGSPYHVPLALKLGGSSAAVADAIAFYCRGQEVDAYAGTTIWDKIVGDFGPTFRYAVVPKIQTAQVVPFNPALRGTFSKSLDIEDILTVDSDNFIPRPIRAVGIRAAGTLDMVGQFMPVESQIQLNQLGACYAPDGTVPGMVIYADPPVWMQMVPAMLSDAQRTALSMAGATTPATAAPDVTGLEALGDVPGLYARWAHNFYLDEVLRGRFLVLSGKLRFDIAPGSIVKVRNKDPLFIRDDALSQSLVGCVSRVSIRISAEEPSAGTSFQLDYVRTERENEEDRTSAADHPLYAKNFTGAPLLHAFLFPDEA